MLRTWNAVTEADEDYLPTPTKGRGNFDPVDIQVCAVCKSSEQGHVCSGGMIQLTKYYLKKGGTVECRHTATNNIHKARAK